MRDATPRPITVVIVGGDWDTTGGRASSYVTQFADALRDSGAVVALYNGGTIEHLSGYILEKGVAGYQAIVWIPNVPNEFPKHRQVKLVHPHALLVVAKRNQDEYTLHELLNRALGLHANLCIDFRRAQGRISARLLDVMGVIWQDHTTDIKQMASMLAGRLEALRAVTRQGTRQVSTTPLTVPDQPTFFDIVRRYAGVFHELIVPEPSVTRFLGNASFRCERGFPSFRDETNTVFVSRRNVDKRYIDASAFVAVQQADDAVLYWGEHKPSVDAPVQLRLYDALPNIRFMLHAHVYLADAPTTTHVLPCGALEEVAAVLATIPDRSTTNVHVNLPGHGCLIMTSDPTQLHDLPFIARVLPEHLTVMPH